MRQIEQAFQWIDGHARDLAASLTALVSIPSVVGSEGACQRLMAERMEGVCDSVDVWEPDVAWLERHPVYFLRGVSFRGRPNVVGVIQGQGGGRSLIVNAHADVVDTGPPDAWKFPPWSGTVSEGKLYGRGSNDDKAGLAAMLYVAQCLRDLKLPLKGKVILESVVDEEWGGGGTLATVQRGYRADAGIIFEPTRMEICPAARGGQAFRVTVPGKGAHPFRSYDGVSALEKALPLLMALKGLEAARRAKFHDPLFERYPIYLPVVIGKISADIIPSKVPERCLFEGLMGYSPAEAYQDARRELEDCIQGAASGDPWLREHPPVVEWLGLNKEGAEISVEHPIVQVLGNSFVQVMRTKPAVVGFPAGCDLPYLIRHGGTPAVIFGPGDPITAHGSNEFVALEEVVQAAKVLLGTILRWCG